MPKDSMQCFVGVTFDLGDACQPVNELA